MIVPWTLHKLEVLKDEPMVLVRDALRLLPENDGALHRFAKNNGFTLLIASTNLVFRQLLEETKSSGVWTKYNVGLPPHIGCIVYPDK